MDFDSIHNHHEQAVYAAVQDRAADYPMLAGRGDALVDVACVALNRLPPRYIRHSVDFAFYLTERERTETEAAIAEAVSFAFEFVQARLAMRARR
jgi:hypothetical protein